MEPLDTYNRKPKVLVVEDQPIAQKMAKIILNSLDCEIDIASNGVEAIQCFLNHNYDLILMDIGLPDKDGFTVTSEMRAIESNASLHPTAIVGLSVHTAQTARKQAIEAGMNEYFVKPITLDMFQKLLKEFVLLKKQGS